MDLKDIARELEVCTTWHSGARGRKLRDLVEALWEQAGGREEPQAGDPTLATPGPGVRSRTTADVAEPTTVDSVGAIGDKPAATPQKLAQAPKPDAAVIKD